MRNFTFRMTSALLALCLLWACQQQPDAEQISAEFNQWIDQQYEEQLQMSPLGLTYLGRKEQYNRIDDLSVQAEDQQLAWRAASVQAMKTKFAYEALNADDQLSYDLWIYEYELAQEGAAFRDLDYVFDQMRGMHTQLPNILINMHKVDSLADMRAYIERIEGSGRAIKQLVERAQRQSELGIRPPKFTFVTVIKQSKSLITGKPFDTSETGAPMYNDMVAKVEALLSAEKIDTTTAEALKKESEEALLAHFKPAYDQLISWLENELTLAEEAPTGVSRHPNGLEFYNYRLKQSTTTSLRADEIHEIGLKEVARIQQEMLAIKDQVGFKGSLKEFFNFVNTDKQFFFPNTDEGRQGYLDESTAYLDAITEKLPDFFGILPKSKLVVKRVEAFREQDGAPQHYFSGTKDGSRPGVYYVHLSNMNAMPKSTMEGVAYHEGNPGHHMQISIAQELESVPQFRTQINYTAYAEGWALYSEILAKEMGGYQNPYYDFGRLVNEIWRAIRLVVDTGLHSKDWTEEQGVQYFKENSSISDGAIRAEVQRYMVMPGQATSYKIGMLKIQELRQRAETELGEQFDIKGFHDTVLGGGALPLALLEKQVDRWIASKK